MEYIDIDKSLIPYRFDITINDETFRFEIDYNSRFDFFTVNLFKNEEVIVLGEKLVYGKPLFLSSQYREVPKPYILPYDLTGQAERVTFENLNEQVFLFIVEGD